MSAVVQLLIQEFPAIVALIQQRHAEANPSAQPLTADEIVAGFESTFTSTIAKDELIKALNAA